MSQNLWVEYKTDKKTSISKVPIKDYEFVGQIIRELKENTQFAIPRNAEITLHGPSGTAISVGDPISSLVPGNSFTNPLRVQISVAFKPASDPELTKFWNSLCRMEPENGFLKFGPRSSLLPEKLKELYIRKAYEDLFQIICNNLNSDNKTKEPIRRMAITGTPGTGKSMFLFYILWRLANREDTKTVILRRQMNHEHIYGFQNDGCWIVPSSTDIRVVLDDPETWYLTDALQPPPDQVNAITILVSSPSEKYYGDFMKLLPIPPLHYLPTWSLEELKRAAHVYFKSPEVVEERFNMIGGIARYVLEEDEDLETKSEFTHRLVHFKVEPPCYTKYTHEF